MFNLMYRNCIGKTKYILSNITSHKSYISLKNAHLNMLCFISRADESNNNHIDYHYHFYHCDYHSTFLRTRKYPKSFITIGVHTIQFQKK